MVDASVVAVGLTVIVAILLGLFFNGIDKDITTDRDKLYPKIAKCIESEFKKYQKAEEPEKENILSKITTLDKFRRNLRKTRAIRNYGFLNTIISVIVVVALLVLLPYVPLNSFLSTSVPIHCYPPVNSISNTFSCYPGQAPTSAIAFLFVAELLVFAVLLEYSKFILLWKMSKVIIQNIDEKNKDLTGIVCKIFKAKGYNQKPKKN
ncbi:MAG: hypothetical protein M1559_00330 [Candidatus Marsarchaeota archaeon]|nr:hypothetical protein [Candidatus Marsarchaeota archaeon]